MSALDETLRALCEKHDLTAISLHFRHDGRPYVSVHHGDSGCELKWGETAEEAIAAAITAANEARAIVPDVPALEIGEVLA